MNNINSEFKSKYHVPAENVMDELGKHMLVDGFPFVLDLKNSHGGYFTEQRTQKNYVDFFTCFASLPIGMNHPKMYNPEFIEYLGKVSINKPSNSDIYTEVMATFVKTFWEVADLSAFKYSFFIEGGALAVENALKAAFDWKVRKNMAKGITGELGHQIIHFREAFHGRSGYTMSLTNTDPNKVMYYPKFTWPRITNPKLRFPLEGVNLENTIGLEAQAVKKIKAAFANNKDDIAAIIIEPIQGEGGDNHFRPEFMKMLRQLADENEALLIFDEVQTGTGITGKWWAHQHYGVSPDIMTFGKKMQVCGIVAGSRLDEVPDNVFHKSSRINSTWGGNLTDMARAARYLEIIEEENLIENAAFIGAHLHANLEELGKEYPELVSNVRGRGLFCAFDMPSGDIRKGFIDKCFEQGLMILPCGSVTVRFRPPLNLDMENMNEGLNIVKSVLDKIGK